MGVDYGAFYVAWDAIMVVGVLPACYFATKTRWEYRGTKDRMRYSALLLATGTFFLGNLFTLAGDAYTQFYDPDSDALSRYETTYDALGILSELFQLILLLSLAFVFFRTAIALLYGMSRNQKLGLNRTIELAGAVGFILLIIFAVVVWALYIWYLALQRNWDGTTFEDLDNAFLTQAKVAVAYEWIYFAFATIFLPIVFLQTLGRRSDRVAVLLFTFAILLVDALHVLEVVNNLVIVHKGNPLLGSSSQFSTGLQITVIVTGSLFALLAIYCLTFMGLRDPKRLTGGAEPAFAPVGQHPQRYHAQEGWPEDAKHDPRASPTELPTAENGLLGQGTYGPQELPGEHTMTAELPAGNTGTRSNHKKFRFWRRG